MAYTYNDPVIFMEYALDVAAACRQQDIRSVAVTAGYIDPEPAVKVIEPDDDRQPTLISPPRGVNFMALESRLVRI